MTHVKEIKTSMNLPGFVRQQFSSASIGLVDISPCEVNLVTKKCLILMMKARPISALVRYYSGASSVATFQPFVL